MIKAVFLDFDGTVYSHKSEQIPSSTIEAIDILNKKGIKTFLCTGRAHAEMDWFDLSKIRLSGQILSSGQVIFDENDNLIYDSPIEGILKEKLLQIFDEGKVPIYFATPNRLFLNFSNQLIADIQEAISSNIPPLGEYEGDKIYMASIFFNDEDTYNEIMKLKDIANITCWHAGAYDIVPKGVDKTTGIDKVLELYNINKDETMGIGDGENDIEMLQHCQIGIAMGNSIKEVKEVADYITDDIDEDGLYNALKHFELI